MADEFLERSLEKARLYYRRGDYEETCAAARECLSADPQNPEALYLLSMSCIYLEYWDEADEAVRALLAEEPEWSLSHAAAGHLLAGRPKADLPRAERHFREAVRLDPEDPWGFATLGLFPGKMGRVEDGITVAWKGLKLDAEDLSCLHVLQVLYRLNKEPEMAEDMEKKALAIDPDNSSLHLEAGLRMLEGGESRAARGRFWESLRLNPTSLSAKMAIADKRARQNLLFRNGCYISVQPAIMIPIIVTPLIWLALSFVWGPFRYLAVISAILVVVGYIHLGVFLLYRRGLLKRIEAGKV